MAINRAVVEAGQDPSAFLNAGTLLCTSLKENVKRIWLRSAVTTANDSVSVFQRSNIYFLLHVSVLMGPQSVL
jgi:hypothetical protein